tara:strand:- start:762 stop:1814 length:1053 start_codon:yes stop_codon:yes gene_type:complete
MTPSELISVLHDMGVRCVSPGNGRVELLVNSGAVPQAAIDLAKPRKAGLLTYLNSNIEKAPKRQRKHLWDLDATDTWMRAIGTIDGMLSDFAALAYHVEAFEGEWDVYFRPGKSLAVDYCEGRKSILESAVKGVIGESVRLNLIAEQHCSQSKPEKLKVKDSPASNGYINQARPTEYKGTVYRSKSEAMFARYLELSLGDWCANRDDGFIATAGFQYEPAYMELSGWRPDFLVFCTSLPCSITLDARLSMGFKYSAPSTSYSIYEYKPSRPTDTYIEEFKQRCNAILSNAYDDDLRYGTTCSIYYGSPFSNDRSVIDVDEGFIEDREHDWLKEYETKVKATRFDLKNQGD